MKRFFNILVIYIFFYFFNCYNNNIYLNQIKQQVSIDLSLNVNNPNIINDKIVKVLSLSTLLKPVYIYSFLLNYNELSIVIMLPWRVYYKVECDKLTGKIKVIDRTIYSHEYLYFKK